jgi:hypothetical protein
MRFVFFLTVLLISTSSFGSVLFCDKVLSGGAIQNQAWAFIDTEKALLRVGSPSTEFPVLTEEFVFPYNAPAIWFDRAKECSSSSKKKLDGTFQNKFVCKSTEGVNTNATLEISGDKKTSKYYGSILISGSPDQDFMAEFHSCR